MKKAKFKRWVPLYLMMAPGLIYLFINNYMPMAGLVVAFKNYNVVDGILAAHGPVSAILLICLMMRGRLQEIRCFIILYLLS